MRGFYGFEEKRLYLDYSQSAGYHEIMKSFTLEYWKDDGWFVGRLTEVPGVFSQGETIEELKENIIDAYKMMIDSEPVPSLPTATSKTIVEIAV